MKTSILILFSLIPFSLFSQNEIHVKLKATGPEIEHLSFYFKEPKLIEKIEIDRLDAGQVVIALDDNFNPPAASFTNTSKQGLFLTERALKITFSYQTDKDVWVSIKFATGRNLSPNQK